MRDRPVPMGTKVVDHVLSLLDAVGAGRVPDRETLGRAAHEQSNEHERRLGTKPSRLIAWDDLGDADREGYQQMEDRIVREIAKGGGA